MKSSGHDRQSKICYKARRCLPGSEGSASNHHRGVSSTMAVRKLTINSSPVQHAFTYCRDSPRHAIRERHSLGGTTRRRSVGCLKMDPDRRRSVLPDASAQFREIRITWMGRLSGRVATLDDHSRKSDYVITRLDRLATRDGRDARDIADLHKD
jgi:hypothetical protein